MVCCSCPKIPAAESCNSNGHHLIAEDQARDIFRTDLKTSLEVTLKKLRQTMTLRATMKERLERTVLSVEKFLDELRQKVSLIFWCFLYLIQYMFYKNFHLFLSLHLPIL
ncbi:hypothetical protein E2C01_075059 [Portunus trituberculatus]|uniref:Uncharacterized protein n=1 Tax=Portunus trituberculatus TaxID=210409 RepID=A0A5B7IF58_PORTR|nr:hypothetical protein [Portunus trituberculatus]